MKTIALFTKLIDLLIGAWEAIRAYQFKEAAKKAEETKNTSDIERLINK